MKRKFKMDLIVAEVTSILTKQEEEELKSSVFSSREELEAGVFGELDEVEVYLFQHDISEDAIDLSLLRELQHDMVDRVADELNLA